MNLEIEEPYLGLAFLTLCAQDYTQVDQLLASAERINPASWTLHQLKQSLAKERHKAPDSVTASAPVIAQIKRLKKPVAASEHLLPRPLQRILGPLAGVFQNPTELSEILELTFGVTDLSLSQQLWLVLQLEDPIPLAETLKDLQLLLERIHPQYTRKMPAFAQDLSQNLAVCQHVLRPLLQRFKRRAIAFEALQQHINYLYPKRFTRLWIKAFFDAVQAPDEADFEVLLNPEQLGKKKESESLQAFVKWFYDFENQ